jgi:hypothetical protein
LPTLRATEVGEMVKRDLSPGANDAAEEEEEEEDLALLSSPSRGGLAAVAAPAAHPEVGGELEGRGKRWDLVAAAWGRGGWGCWERVSLAALTGTGAGETRPRSSLPPSAEKGFVPGARLLVLVLVLALLLLLLRAPRRYLPTMGLRPGEKCDLWCCLRWL